jgi:hypothetical protein
MVAKVLYNGGPQWVLAIELVKCILSQGSPASADLDTFKDCYLSVLRALRDVGTL